MGTSFRTAIACIGLSITASFLPSADARAEYETSIVLYATEVPTYVGGGSEVAYAQHESNSGWVSLSAYYDQFSSSGAEVDAINGSLKVEAYGSVRLNPICDPCSVITPNSSATAQFWDAFTINPGGGFVAGDTVQVRLLAGLGGDVFLTGKPMAGSEWGFTVSFGPSNGIGSDDLFQIQEYSGGLYPPKDEAVGPQSWDQMVSVTVGQKYYLWTELFAHVGGSSFQGWPIDTYTNYVDFYGTGPTGLGYAGLGYASGYEGVNIVSSAGATIAAVPEPETYAMLLAGLALVGGAARLKKSVLAPLTQTRLN